MAIISASANGDSLYWSTLLFTGKMVAPIFILVFIGVLLKRTRVVDESIYQYRIQTGIYAVPARSSLFQHQPD
ncbi:hypothetical protein [Pokkaliibacter plantistimulans]|uniref:hypothetical protein n=1 Tax=Pokkaliibacter plantistimulans TaxID=1635171 RepID=UPI001FAF7E4E|nr:hypothetical protein [Pokkaliibacter plantistimulans]